MRLGSSFDRFITALKYENIISNSCSNYKVKTNNFLELEAVASCCSLFPEAAVDETGGGGGGLMGTRGTRISGISVSYQCY